ncbi:hypothetical protein, partial [Segatella oulorum]|uniref:hypothetical protein n=1 Tax=Segatella oulorum TaxID=28136 RepID=UPI0028F0331F
SRGATAKQPCGAENPEALLPNNPAAQKILRRYCQTNLRRRKSRGATAKQPCGAENPEALLPNNLAAQKFHREKWMDEKGEHASQHTRPLIYSNFIC